MNTKRKSKRRVKKSPKKPAVQGWRTSDQDEIARRQERGATEPCRITIATGGPFYGDFKVSRERGGSYDVEIRSLTEPLNSCSCPDHAVNRLGTCKHIEAVLHKAAKGKKRRFQLAAQAGSTQIEIFLDRRDENVHIQWPQSGRARSKIRDLLEPFFSADGTLISKATSALPKLQRKQQELQKQRLIKARQQMSKAERKHKMAQVLAAGGFSCEALPALNEATETALFSLALLEGHTVTPLTMGFIESTLVKQGKVPESCAGLVARLREDHTTYSEQQASSLLEEGAALMTHITQTLNEAALR